MVISSKPTLTRLKQFKWGTFFQMFYVEPIVFVLVFSHNLSGTIMKNEVIYQTCVAIFHFNETDCLQLGSNNMTRYLQEIETEIQPYVANLLMIRTLLESIVPAICGVFVGSWSDHYGRKPLLLVSMLGAIICKLSQYYLVSPWYYILAVIPHSLLGGNCVFSVAAFCFISDVTDVKSRPYRMISVEAILSGGLMMGSLLSSYVLAATSATFVFSLSGVLICLATAYTALYVPESLKYSSKEVQLNADDICCNDVSSKCATPTKAADWKEGKTEQRRNESESVLHKVQKDSKDLENNTKQKGELHEEKEVVRTGTDGLFSYSHVKDMWSTCFKARPSYDRSIILLVTGNMFLHIFVWDGAMTVFYLFVREKFQWSVREFTFYETVNHVASVTGALIGFLIMRKVFNMSVVALALIAVFSDIIRSVIQGLAGEAWHLYMAVAAGVFKAIGAPMCRTIVSNIVPASDLGKIFSIKNILQAIAPFAAAPLYTIVYKASLTSYPGFFNVVSAMLYSLGFGFLLFVLGFKIKNKERYDQILK